jgi:uncharacterized repeat protein (TIGR03843 family)
VTDELADRLARSPIEVIGRFTDASNATLLVRMTDRDPRPIAELAAALGREPEVADLDPDDLAVHKPRRGEAPLWDFPSGTLHRREIAAYEVADALGWDLVPLTVLRADGPFGPGSMQRFVPHDPELHYFALLEAGDPDLLHQLVAMVLLDLVIDNADRKGGHVLLEVDARGPGRLRVIDHGVSFNLARKLRTVAWDFAGQPVPEDLRSDLERLRARLDDTDEGGLAGRLTALLTAAEVDVLRARTDRTLELERLPEPVGNYPYPWPLL